MDPLLATSGLAYPVAIADRQGTTALCPQIPHTAPTAFDCGYSNTECG